jgi:hypothetical protein
MATNAPLSSDRGASRIPVEPTPQALEERRRRAKRAAMLLGLVAASFYIGFMILTYFRSQH